jgi:hypothetical protein
MIKKVAIYVHLSEDDAAEKKPGSGKSGKSQDETRVIG